MGRFRWAWVLGLAACDGADGDGKDATSTHPFATDFAYTRECTELCAVYAGDEDAAIAEFEANCDDSAEAVTAECRSACEEVLTDVSLDCAACILEDSEPWDGWSCHDSGGCSCDTDWSIGSPVDCVKRCE